MVYNIWNVNYTNHLRINFKKIKWGRLIKYQLKTKNNTSNCLNGIHNNFKNLNLKTNKSQSVKPRKTKIFRKSIKIQTEVINNCFIFYAKFSSRTKFSCLPELQSSNALYVGKN